MPAGQLLALPASIPSPPINQIPLFGGLAIHFYALCILLGIFLGWRLLERRYAARGGPADVVGDAVLWAVLAGIVGARIYHVVTLPEAYFGPHGDPWRVVRIWEGGLGIMGGVAAGALTVWLLLRRRGLRLAPFADAIAPAMLVAQAVGRWGNWFNQELFGGPTTLPWGLEIDDAHLPHGYPSGTLFHPTFLYESLWNLLGAAVLIAIDRGGRVTHGRLFGLYLVWYGAGRTVTEGIRIDETILHFGLRVNQVFSLFVLLVGLVVLLVATIRARRGIGGGIHLPGRGPDGDVDDVDGVASAAATAGTAGSAAGSTAADRAGRDVPADRSGPDGPVPPRGGTAG